MRERTFDGNYFLEVTSATIVKKSDKSLERRSRGEMKKYFIFIFQGNFFFILHL